MKKIIDGLTYNTETGRKVGRDYNGCMYTDFEYCSETLYCSKKGAYFLHCEGGAYSKYGIETATGFHAGSKIVPITIEDAREWSKNHLEVDEYEKEFGVVEKA